MKVGLVARAEERGLGSLTRDFYRHAEPDKTLVVVPRGVARHGLESHLDWYPDATVAFYDGQLDRRTCLDWLDGLDVVVSYETFYDWRICAWARELGVATVCELMPEWWRPRWASSPTAWWTPTSWRMEQLPTGTKHVPVPMTAPQRRPREHGPFRWLHVAGAQTEADRNGTRAVEAAARLLTEPQEIVVRTQSPLDLHAPRLTVELGSLPSRWALYDDVDALLMPRRYAGLSLPVLEALAVGLPVVMTDTSPQNVDWPVQTVPVTQGDTVGLFGHQIPTVDADPAALAALMDRWATDPDEVVLQATQARTWAAENTWEARAPQIRSELELACGLVVA